MWLEKEKVFLFKNFPFREALLNSPDLYKKEIFNVIESSFNEITLFEDAKDDLVIVAVKVFGSNQLVSHNDVSVFVEPGDALVVVDPSKYSFFNNYYFVKDFIFYCSLEKLPIGNGNKKFDIVCTITDKYKIIINADSEEEAIKLAHSVPPSKWEHLDIDSHLNERQIIRMARWGNFEIKEL